MANISFENSNFINDFNIIDNNNNNINLNIESIYNPLENVNLNSNNDVIMFDIDLYKKYVNFLSDVTEKDYKKLCTKYKNGDIDDIKDFERMMNNYFRLKKCV